MKHEYDIKRYQQTSQVVLGFHGCDRSVVDKIVNSSEIHLSPSKNKYDWLGNGIYFWQNDPQRAYEWACQRSENSKSKIKDPAVIGAVIDLKLCLNLSERASVELIKDAYESLKTDLNDVGIKIEEFLQNSMPDEGGFSLVRPLDCAVIEYLHSGMNPSKGSFDTVLGYFQEGKPAFYGAGIMEKSHIQICVRNTDCIKGYFLPRIK